MKTVLVAGASGLIGEAAVAQFAADGWNVITVSRRAPEQVDGVSVRHLAVDLRDPAACQAAFGALRDVTHVVYAALYEKPGLYAGWLEADQMETNLSMLRNLLEPLSAASDLQHVSLLQGAKAYGAHAGHRMPIPARERAPRVQHENFYWLQEDLLRATAKARGFTWTIFRPVVVVGAAWGAAMNPLIALGVYAAVRRELGQPFAYTGGVRHAQELVDPRLLGQAFAWAADAKAAADETFNVTNGDVFSWVDTWPALAEAFGAETGPDEPQRIAEFLPAHADVWDRIVAREGLRPIGLLQLLGESHHYADILLRPGLEVAGPPSLLSTIKIRQAGFAPCFDSEDTLRHWAGVLAARRIIPGARAALEAAPA